MQFRLWLEAIDRSLEAHIQGWRDILSREWDASGKYGERNYTVSPEMKQLALELGKSKEDFIKDWMEKHEAELTRFWADDIVYSGERRGIDIAPEIVAQVKEILGR